MMIGLQFDVSCEIVDMLFHLLPGLRAGPFFVSVIVGIGLCSLVRPNGRQLSDPIPEIVRQDQRAAPALNGAEFTGFDRFIKGGAPGTGHSAGLFDRIG